MAKNVTVQGASYTAVPAIDVPQTGGGTARFTDTSVVTATASDVASGKVFVDADGSQVTGTASGGGGALIIGINYDEQTETVSLDKTWQEIYDAVASGRGAVLVDEYESEGESVWNALPVLFADGFTSSNGGGDLFRIVTNVQPAWETDSADGYPQQSY